MNNSDQEDFDVPLLTKLTFEDYGIGVGASHDKSCAVNHRDFAIYDQSSGVFQPSWNAQKLGWRLVRANTPFKLWLLKTFFGLHQ